MAESDCTIRYASKRDFDGIVELFNKHRHRPRKREWFEYKYLNNPEGDARLLIATDSSGTILGIKAMLPRRFTSAKTGELSAEQSVDILVAPEARGRGVYSKISAYYNQDSNTPRIGFPNDQSVGFAHRSGQHEITPLDKWSFPVALEELLSGKPLGFLAPAARMLAKFYALFWLGKHPADIEMMPISRFTRDFEMPPGVLHGIRSADYLNWRFIDNPTHSYDAFEFFENDESIGYCVYTIAKSKVEILDFVASSRHRGCFRLFVDHCRDMRITGLRFRGIGLQLGKFGFTRRCDPINVFSARFFPPGPILITLADRDY